MPVTAKEQAQQDACTGVATAFTIMSILVVALRTYARTFIVRNFGKDDWAMVMALVFTLAYLAAIYVLRANGMGFSGKTLSLSQMTVLIQTTLAIEITYYLLVFCVKVSILFFYLRIAVERKFELASKATIGFLTVFTTVCVIVCVTQCIPLHKMWDFTGLVQGHCINTTALFYTTSSIHILTDMVILALPIQTLLKIQRPNHEKFALIVVFGLGIFSCIASIVRLHSIRIYTESPDPFYDSVPINLWSMVEVNIGIWCASIPALKALISRRRGDTQASGSYKYHSRDKSGGRVSGGASGKLGGSSADRSHGSQGLESFDLKTLEESGELQAPQQARKSNGDSAWSGSSQERIYAPGTDPRVQ